VLSIDCQKGFRSAPADAQNASSEGSGKTTNVDFQIEIVPADGIRLPFYFEAETSERRRFLSST